MICAGEADVAVQLAPPLTPTGGDPYSKAKHGQETIRTADYLTLWATGSWGLPGTAAGRRNAWPMERWTGDKEPGAPGP